MTAPVCPALPKEKADAMPDFPLPEEPKDDIVPVQEKPVSEEPAPEPTPEPK